jgi:two-component system nitrogen regulation sensor histidine kinase NtrY
VDWPAWCSSRSSAASRSRGYPRVGQAHTVRVGWSRASGLTRQLELWVDDTGPGLPETSNLFVPFFTTKPQGSGIGLVLSRQIAEAHDGSLTLENRRSRQGCRARLRLPVKAT